MSDTDIVVRARNITQQAFAEVTAALNELEGKTGKVGHAAKESSGFLSTMAGTFTGFLTGQAVMGGLSAAFNFAKGAAIGMNSTLETTTLQFTTMMGDAGRAEKHVKSLFDFAATTPFETGPIIAASRSMQLFGGDALNTQENLRRVGDAAAVAGAPIDMVGTHVGKLYSALKNGTPMGEPIQRLMELGVMSGDTRLKMDALSKTAGGGQKAWELFSGEMDKNAGAMSKMAGTWAGVTSTLSDAVTMLAAGAFKPLFELLKGGIGSLNELLGSKAFTAGAAALATSISSGVTVAFTAFSGSTIRHRAKASTSSRSWSEESTCWLS